MFRIFDAPGATPVQKFNANAVGKLAYNILFGARNGTFQQAALADTTHQVTSLALASGASVTLWAVSASNVAQIAFLAVSASVAGNYQFLSGGVVYIDMVLLANQTTVLVNSWPGVFIYPAGVTISIKNNTAGPADVRATAIGAELLA